MTDASATRLSRIEIDADVLVIGGGMAAAWAAIGAARSGTVREYDVSAYASTLRVLSRRGPSVQPSYGRVNEVEIFGY